MIKDTALPLVIAGSIAFAACSTMAGETSEPTGADNADSRAPNLSGTGWQLLALGSADTARTPPTPEAASRYTLNFGMDGSVYMQADCNRGRGSLQALLPPALAFTPIAATKAMCPPGSLDNDFLGALQGTTSYRVTEGNLDLLTDGMIALSLAPLTTDDVQAEAFGFSYITDDIDALRSLVLARALDRYYESSDISIDPDVVASLARQQEEGKRQLLGQEYIDERAAMSSEERAEVDRYSRLMAESMVRSWLINRALYKEYGGRLIYQQLGPEPIDAYRALLEAARDSGEFALLDEAGRATFWDYFDDSKRHDFMAAGSDDERNAFAVPPWQRESQSATDPSDAP